MPPTALRAVLLFLLPLAMARSEVPVPAIVELAQRIAQKANPPSVGRLEFRNASSLPAEQAAEVRRALERELRRRRVRLADGPEAPVVITITFSENRSGAVWVADIRKGEARDVVIQPVLLPESPPDKTGTRMALEKTLLWSEDRPILDLAVGDNDLLILEPGQLTHVWKTGDRWDQSATVALSMPKPWPRDLRGRLEVAGETIRIYLPGFACNGTLERPAKIACEARSEQWPAPLDAEIVAGRNFFAAKDLPPFYSAARFGERGKEMLAIASVDGRVYLYSGHSEQAGTVDGWGSDIVGIQSPCGSGWQILATRPEADEGRDAVQAYDIVDRRAVPVGPPLELPGAMTALWPLMDGRKAVAVVLDPATKRYAAYSLAVTCGY